MAMAFISEPVHVIFFVILSALQVSSTLSATVVEDLNSLHPPPDFNVTIMRNCIHNPSHKYCNSSSSPVDLNEIFKSTIVASHLCKESKNPNCVESFPKIDLRSRPKIAPLYLSFNFFWKFCPISVMSIDLSNNSIMGGLPVDVLLCTQIQALDLSQNQLSGDIPVEGFSVLANLTILNLSYNHFSEMKVSDAKFFERFNSSSFLHSGLFPGHNNYTIKAVMLLIGFPIFVLLMICCFGWLCFVRPDFLPRMLRRNHKFTTWMLKAATNRFSKKNLVSKSEGVAIYKGILRDGTRVKIEIYRDDVSRDISNEFVEKCKVLVQFRHKNLVRVLGWCNSRKTRAIVTEWTQGGNIEIWLSGSAPSWKHRLKVLIGVVEAMCYLQEQWPEVYYDLRTSSVLLPDNLDPLISRFKIEHHHRSTKHIYKFGLFLLEIITNRRPLEEFEQGEAGFIEYIRTNYPGNLQLVVDERMKLTENMLDQAEQGIGLGLMCLDHPTEKLPSLGQIHKMITRAYKSCLVLTSGNDRRSQAGTSHEHRRVQFRESSFVPEQ